MLRLAQQRFSSNNPVLYRNWRIIEILSSPVLLLEFRFTMTIFSATQVIIVPYVAPRFFLDNVYISILMIDSYFRFYNKNCFVSHWFYSSSSPLHDCPISGNGKHLSILFLFFLKSPTHPLRIIVCRLHGGVVSFARSILNWKLFTKSFLTGISIGCVVISAKFRTVFRYY